MKNMLKKLGARLRKVFYPMDDLKDCKYIKQRNVFQMVLGGYMAVLFPPKTTSQHAVEANRLNDEESTFEHDDFMRDLDPFYSHEGTNINHHSSLISDE